MGLRILSLFVFMFSVMGTQGWAVQGESPVAVEGMRMGLVRDTAGASWYQVEVELKIDLDGSGRDRFSEPVEVGLLLAPEVAGAMGGIEFFRAKVAFATLESGRAMVRFYLPPAIVKRDRLQGAARFWVVDLRVGEKVIAVTRARVGPGLSGPAALENFRQQAGQRAPANDGVLLPQYLTPFAQDVGDAALPVLRRDAVGAAL